MEATQSYIKVKTTNEAMQQINSLQNAIFVAGGTDVFVNKQQGNIEAGYLIDVSGIEDLMTCRLYDDRIEIGAMFTLEKIIQSETINTHFPTLVQAALAVATPVIRKTATIGGNVLCENRCFYYNQSEWWREAVGHCLKCNGDICLATGGRKNCFSKFVSDTAPVLIAYGATAILIDADGERCVPLESIYTGDGIVSVTLNKKTLLKSIEIPLSTKKVIFKKLRPRKTLDFTSLTTAVSLDNKMNLRMVIGGVDPKPIVVEGNLKKEDLLQLVTTAIKKPRVVENDFYSRTYRKDMIKVFIENSLNELGIQIN
ncbi:MAG: FAD binding domain-containing protein [Bacteroidetes bacterium]|nr:FAD binding domain-containing protein [Bacteroidota bacterium]